MMRLTPWGERRRIPDWPCDRCHRSFHCTAALAFHAGTHPDTELTFDFDWMVA